MNRGMTVLQTVALPLGYVTEHDFLDNLRGQSTRLCPLEPNRLGADYGARTRHLDLGKVALYQMS